MILHDIARDEGDPIFWRHMIPVEDVAETVYYGWKRCAARPQRPKHAWARDGVRDAGGRMDRDG